MLIDEQQDERALLRAEDEAIRESEKQTEHQATALDALAEILNARETQVQPEAEAGGSPRG